MNVRTDHKPRPYNPERLAVVLLAPVVSEKGTFLADKHEQVIFKVAPTATKPQIEATSPSRVRPRWTGCVCSRAKLSDWCRRTRCLQIPRAD